MPAAGLLLYRYAPRKSVSFSVVQFWRALVGAAASRQKINEFIVTWVAPSFRGAIDRDSATF
jgi:hypothetical protein